MAIRINAMPLLTALFLGALLVQLSNGQCRTDCACVPTSQPTPEDRCCLYIRENLPPGSPVGNADNLTLIQNFDTATYQFTPDDDQLGALFNFSVATGAIVTAVSIDREAISPLVDGDCIRLFVRGIDGGGMLSSIGRFGIVIEDMNDNRPRFDASVSILNITVRESNAPHTLNCQSSAIELRNVRARDSDEGSNAEVTYKVAEGHGSSLFRVIDPQFPCVDNLVPMDRENTSVSYSFVLVAMDGGDPRLSSNITVIFTLEDVNDNAPVFLDATTNISVFENELVGSVLHRFNATDLDIETQPLRYSLMPSDSIPFQINPETGELNLTRVLDVDASPTYHLTVLAIDSNSQTAMLNITVIVIDVNELATISTSPNPPAELMEEVIPSPPNIFSIEIEDSDKLAANTMNEIQFISGGEYFEVVFPIITVGGKQIFRIRQHTVIDRENVTNDIVQLSIIIEQMGHPPLQDQFQHNFTILDKNDNEPYLTTTQFNITEDNSSQGQGTSTPVRRIELKNYVRDDDAGDNGTIASYCLISVRSTNGQNFTEDFRRSNALVGTNQEIHDGDLQLPTPFDREVLGDGLTVTMNFTDRGTPPMFSVDSFTIKIMDINDNSPVFQFTAYTFNVTENDRSDSIGSVMATDDDDPTTGNGLVVYSLDETQGDHDFFTVDQHDGTIRNKQVFNRETKGIFTFYISASDSASPPRTASESAEVTVIVLDVNDEPPAFEMERFIFSVNSGANVGDFVGNVVATDPDEDPTENLIVYKFLVPSSYFSINNFTGLITIARVLSIQDSPYNLTVVAFNPGFEHLQSTAAVSVVVVESNLFVIIIGGVSGGAALLIVAIIFLCCLILCVRQMSKTGKLEVDGNGAHLNNQKPILKTLPATNGQQRSVKFSTTVEETHYDPSGTEVIRKESNIVSGDDSPQTSLRTAGSVPNGAMSTSSPEIVDYDMSPNLGINGDIPSHHRPQYPRHGRITSPIMLQEELNPSEFSQSTGSVVDDRNTYNSEGEEAESTFSDAPSNFNTSIPRFGRQTVQVEEHHHPADLGRYVPPPTHPPLDIHRDLHSHLPPVHHIHGPGPHSSPGHLPELRAHNLAVLNAQYASSSHPPGVPPSVEDIRDLSISSLPRNIGHHHHHHGSIGSPHTSTPPQTRHIQRPVPPPSIRQPPPVSIPHSIITPAPSNGHTNSRNYPHPLVMPEAFPSRPPSDVHRFDSFIPSFTDYGDTSTYASTELNEALEFKYEAEPDFCSLTATDYGENDTEL